MSISARMMHPVRSGPRVDPHLIGNDPIAICAYEPWMADAACLDVDPELFYPDKAGAVQSRAAKRICAGCLVRDTCLAHALKTHEPHGVWGGKSAKERQQMRRTA